MAHPTSLHENRADMSMTPNAVPQPAALRSIAPPPIIPLFDYGDGGNQSLTVFSLNPNLKGRSEKASPSSYFNISELRRTDSITFRFSRGDRETDKITPLGAPILEVGDVGYLLYSPWRAVACHAFDRWKGDNALNSPLVSTVHQELAVLHLLHSLGRLSSAAR